MRLAREQNTRHLISPNQPDRTLDMNFIKEFWKFLKVCKKLWLAPLILVLVILGGLLVLAQGSVVAPFVYTLF